MPTMDKTILDYLKRKLKDAGPKHWASISIEINKNLPEEDAISEHFMRKVAYGDRENPGLKNVQPLLDYFKAEDAK